MSQKFSTIVKKISTIMKKFSEILLKIWKNSMIFIKVCECLDFGAASVDWDVNKVNDCVLIKFIKVWKFFKYFCNFWKFLRKFSKI